MKSCKTQKQGSANVSYWAFNKICRIIIFTEGKFLSIVSFLQALGDIILWIYLYMYHKWITIRFMIHRGCKFEGEGNPRNPQKLSYQKILMLPLLQLTKYSNIKLVRNPIPLSFLETGAKFRNIRPHCWVLLDLRRSWGGGFLGRQSWASKCWWHCSSLV